MSTLAEVRRRKKQAEAPVIARNPAEVDRMLRSQRPLPAELQDPRKLSYQAMVRGDLVDFPAFPPSRRTEKPGVPWYPNDDPFDVSGGVFFAIDASALMELLTEDEPVPGAKWIVEGVALGPHTTGACLGSQAQKDKRADALQKIVNCAHELKCCHPARFDYCHARAWDHRPRKAPALKACWTKIADFIDEALASGGKVLVHGCGGHSRSASTLAAWLTRSRGLDAAEALEIIQAKRDVAKPTKVMRALLDEWVEALYECDGEPPEGFFTMTRREMEALPALGPAPAPSSFFVTDAQYEGLAAQLRDRLKVPK